MNRTRLPRRRPPDPIRTERLVLREPEACVAALDWFAAARPGEPVVLCTQTANDRSMRLAAKLGFAEVQRFEEWGAEQWLGVWSA